MYSDVIINLGKKRISGEIIDEALFALQSLLEKHFPEKQWHIYRDDTAYPTDYELIPRTAELESRVQCCINVIDSTYGGAYAVFIQSTNPKSYYYELGMRIALLKENGKMEKLIPISSMDPAWKEASEICKMVGGQLLLAVKIVQA